MPLEVVDIYGLGAPILPDLGTAALILLGRHGPVDAAPAMHRGALATAVLLRAAGDADVRGLPLHLRVHIAEVPAHVLAAEFFAKPFLRGDVSQLHVLRLRLQLLELRQVVVPPHRGEARIVVDNRRHVHVVWSVFRVSEQVPHTAARVHIDVPTTTPDLHGGLDMVAAPLPHLRVIKPEAIPPVPPDGEDAAGCGRRGHWLVAFIIELATVGRRREDQIHVPLEAPMPMSAPVVLVEILLRDDVKRRLHQCVRGLLNAQQKGLQPIPVDDGVGLQKNQDIRSGHTDCLHLRLDEPQPLLIDDDPDLRTHRRELRLVCE
mmetsp:Transcript_3090/g.12001  ORF Transcript_3090/g.12001 Transcript_3090/m.12001 type:complete len:319 (+) Transcript_3090:49-1005(+)